MRRRSRTAEPRIVAIESHPREDVCLAVAAEFCGMDRRALNHYINAGRLQAFLKGRMLRVRVSDLAEFKAWLDVQHARVPRSTAETTEQARRGDQE